MIALTILGALLLLFLLLLFLPVRIRVDYRSGQPLRLRLYVLFIPLRLSSALLDRIPSRKGDKEPVKKKKKASPKPEKEKAKAKKGLFSDKGQVWELLKESRRVLRKLCKNIAFYRFEVKGRVARPDAHATALAYGRMSALAAVFVSLLEELFTLRKPKVCLTPDFCSDTSTWDISIGVGIRPISLLAAVMKLLIAFFSAQPAKQKKKVKPRKRQNKKGGSVYESASHQ